MARLKITVKLIGGLLVAIWFIGFIFLKIQQPIEKRISCVEEEGFWKGFFWCEKTPKTKPEFIAENSQEWMNAVLWPILIIQKPKPEEKERIEHKSINEKIDKKLEEIWLSLPPVFYELILRGDNDAKCFMGMKLYDPYDSDYDERSTSLLKLAAEEGNMFCGMMLGGQYAFGNGVSMDKDLAIYWLEKALEPDLQELNNSMEIMISKGVPVNKKAIKDKWITYFSGILNNLQNEITDPVKQYNLGVKYYNTPSDYHKAFQWFHKAALQGDGPSQRNLGVMFENGNGVEQNHEKAIEWYTKSATSGYSQAFLDLCAAYSIGPATILDKDKAIFWCTKADQHGHKEF